MRPCGSFFGVCVTWGWGLGWILESEGKTCQDKGFPLLPTWESSTSGWMDWSIGHWSFSLFSFFFFLTIQEYILNKIQTL